MSEQNEEPSKVDSKGDCFRRETAQCLLKREIQSLKDRASSLQILLDKLGTETGTGTAEEAVWLMYHNRGNLLR